ncbi:alpha/beta hydrolase [Polaribacter sp. PL03]|uniref:alpha/beta hydrolase family protein n=1 Tax=Polaribacter sp. PL03 TaxID=3088353 RepID=UPI0029CD5020|nr:alpha/beta hydrolase [Polaribacter sp. PL03]MDX6746870.1 alpha/beta hydrolase [Polaribacter sp. PL03]
MIRVITYVVVYLFGISIATAQIKSEEITINNKKIQLPGTLTFSEEKIPLIIWVHGSGPVDRNGNQPAQNIKANYIKQFRDAVNKQNIAFFSYDKRTANKNNGLFLKNTKVIDFALDAEEVINYFKEENRFSKIILIGHSQGSLIALLASKNVDKYISLAGAGETIDKTIVKQISKNNLTLGEAAQQQFDTLRKKGKIDVVNPFLMSVFAKQNQPFLYSWLQLNPIEEIKKLTIPVLIINGDKDLQVKIEDAKALHAAKPASKLVIIENMNHVLKDIQKDEDNLASYYSSEFPISEKLIETIVQFVKK